MTEKRKINIQIEDLDDVNKVLIAIDNLLRTILEYYIDTDWHKLQIIVMSCSAYFGNILRQLGYKEEDFKNE